MKRTIVFYRTSYSCPFENFLDLLPGRIVKKITWLLSAVQDREISSELYFRETVRDKDIQECLVNFQDNVFKILCFFHNDEIIILWGGLQIKFQDLTEEQEIRAIRYKKDFLIRKGII